MTITIFPRGYHLYKTIKNEIKAFLPEKFSNSGRPINLKLYILKKTRRSSWPHYLENRIMRRDKLSLEDIKIIEVFSSQNSFLKFFDRFKKNDFKYKYLYFCKRGLTFINWNNKRWEISCLIYENFIDLNGKGWVREAIGSSLYIYRTFLYLNPLNRTLLLHAACIEREGEGYLFLGGNGSGKSTICSLSKKYNIVHDDMIGVECEKIRNGFKLYAIDNPLNRIKLKYIFFIKKSKGNRLIRITTRTAFREGLRSIFNFKKNFIFQDLSVDKIDMAMALFKQIPSFHLYFKKDPTFWDLIERLNSKIEKGGNEK